MQALTRSMDAGTQTALQGIMQYGDDAKANAQSC